MQLELFQHLQEADLCKKQGNKKPQRRTLFLIQTEKILNFKLPPQIETSANIYSTFNFMYLEMYNMGITFLL